MAAGALYAGMAGYQLASSYFAAQNIMDTAELNRDIAEMNAEFAEIDAWQAEREGESQAAQYQTVIDQTIGQQRASLAAADVDLEYGSASTIMDETEYIGRLNQMEMERQGELQAMGYKAQARQYIMQGALGYSQSSMQASQTMIQGVAGAAQTGLTGYERGYYGG